MHTVNSLSRREGVAKPLSLIVATDPDPVGACGQVGIADLGIRVAAANILATADGVVVRALDQQCGVLSAVYGKAEGGKVGFQNDNVVRVAVSKADTGVAVLVGPRNVSQRVGTRGAAINAGISGGKGDGQS